MTNEQERISNMTCDQLREYIGSLNLSIKSTFVRKVEKHEDKDGRGHFSWSVTVTNHTTGERHTLPFRMGLGYEQKKFPYNPIAPTLYDVLSSWVSDYQASEYNFLDFCDNYGYDSDSRKAERMYHGCCEEAREVVRVLGRDMLANLQYAGF